MPRIREMIGIRIEMIGIRIIRWGMKLAGIVYVDAQQPKKDCYLYFGIWR